jgi:biotin operon repressor
VSGELVRVFGDRPGHVDVPSPSGGSVRVSIAAHDAWYLAELAEWRQRLASAHPHGGGTSRKFRDMHRLYKGFEGVERRWYAVYGLQPPARSLASPRQPSAVRAARVSTRAQQIAAYLTEHPDAKPAEVAFALGMAASNVRACVAATRPVGAPPRQQDRLLAMLADRRPHATAACCDELGITRAVLQQIVMRMRGVGHHVAEIRLGGVRRSWLQVLDSIAAFDDASPASPQVPPRTARQEAVLVYLAQRPAALAREIAAALGTSEKSVHRAIDALRDQGVAIPDRRGTTPHRPRPSSAGPAHEGAAIPDRRGWQPPPPTPNPQERTSP